MPTVNTSYASARRLSAYDNVLMIKTTDDRLWDHSSCRCSMIRQQYTSDSSLGM